MRRIPDTTWLPNVRATSSVVVGARAQATLARHAPASADGRETGGIVLGHDDGLGGTIHVRHCGGPGPRALREPDRFCRDLAFAQQLAEEAAQRDGARWIGEWHTHLNEAPEPSDTDLRTYRQLLMDSEAQLTRVLALILTAGAGNNWAAPQVFAWSFTGSVLRALPIVLEPQEQQR